VPQDTAPPIPDQVSQLHQDTAPILSYQMPQDTAPLISDQLPQDTAPLITDQVHQDTAPLITDQMPQDPAPILSDQMPQDTAPLISDQVPQDTLLQHDKIPQDPRYMTLVKHLIQPGHGKIRIRTYQIYAIIHLLNMIPQVW